MAHQQRRRSVAVFAMALAAVILAADSVPFALGASLRVVFVGVAAAVCVFAFAVVTGAATEDTFVTLMTAFSTPARAPRWAFSRVLRGQATRQRREGPPQTIRAISGRDHAALTGEPTTRPQRLITVDDLLASADV